MKRRRLLRLRSFTLLSGFAAYNELNVLYTWSRNDLLPELIYKQVVLHANETLILLELNFTLVGLFTRYSETCIQKLITHRIHEQNSLHLSVFLLEPYDCFPNREFRCESHNVRTGTSIIAKYWRQTLACKFTIVFKSNNVLLKRQVLFGRLLNLRLQPGGHFLRCR